MKEEVEPTPTKTLAASVANPIPSEKPTPPIPKDPGEVTPPDNGKPDEKPATVFNSSAEIIQNFEHGLKSIESEEDLSKLFEQLGLEGISDSDLKEIYEKIGANGENLKKGNILDEIIVLNKSHSHWALNLKDGNRIFFDIKKDAETGTWKIENLKHSGDSTLDAILEKGNAAQMNNMLVAHSFVQFAINQEFAKAKQLVMPGRVSDVELAGLCILFDEGGYKLREHKGIVNATPKPKPLINAYWANIVSDTNRPSSFTIHLRRKVEKDPWKVDQMNFSSLLEEFVKANGGNEYFSPFVANPKGGDSIVVYFDFDTQELSQRTQRQLRIVANILKIDSKKKIKLTGHTDAKGTPEYNRALSTKRAIAVRDYLVSQGVAKGQITTIGYGAHRPRKSNTFEDGSDNPEGRKVNRRAEIYLDF